MGYLAQKVGADVDALAKGMGGLDPRIGSRFLNAGIGWGGSCFGKDTAALVATARKNGLEMRIVQAARDVNYSLRQWIVNALQEKIGDLNGRRVTLLGFSFKPNTDDLRDAPSIDISKELIKRGAIVTAHDPPVALKNARLYYPDLGVVYEDDLSKALENPPEAVLLLTEWQDYLHIDWQNVPKCVIIDGRNHLDHTYLKNLGFNTTRFGN